MSPSIIHRTKGHFLNALAYADDILLMAEDEKTLQSLFSVVESVGAAFGLRINHGAGKTEILDVCGGPCKIVTAAGEIVRHTNEYVHLGVITGNWRKDFSRRKRQAWRVLVSFRWLWKSGAPVSFKRSIARRLIDCILLYGAYTYPKTDNALLMLHQAHARMLRYALNMPINFKTFMHVPTEEVYGDTPYITAVLVGMELSAVGHWARDYALRHIHHPVIEALCIKTQRVKNARGHCRSTPAEDIATMCHFDTIDEVLEAACKRKMWKRIRSCAIVETCRQTQELINKVRVRAGRQPYHGSFPIETGASWAEETDLTD